MEIALHLGSHSLEATLAHHKELDYSRRHVVLVPEVSGVWVVRNDRRRKIARPSAKLCEAILKSLKHAVELD